MESGVSHHSHGGPIGTNINNNSTNNNGVYSSSGPRSNSSSSSSPPAPAGSNANNNNNNNNSNSVMSSVVIPQPISASKMSNNSHATNGTGRKYQCKMCPQVGYTCPLNPLSSSRPEEIWFICGAIFLVDFIARNFRKIQIHSFSLTGSLNQLNLFNFKIKTSL